jgi:hypothetical protein
VLAHRDGGTGDDERIGAVHVLREKERIAE